MCVCVCLCACPCVSVCVLVCDCAFPCVPVPHYITVPPYKRVVASALKVKHFGFKMTLEILKENTKFYKIIDILKKKMIDTKP